MNSPFFTVVIPTYNRADLLSKSIDSVLNQSFRDFEIIVVDNCSSDHTPQVMDQYKADPRILYFRNMQNMERGYSRNLGFRKGSGEFLTLLDSDDVMYPDCLQDAFDYFQQNPSIRVFHNLYEFVDDQGKPRKAISLQPVKNQYKQICKGNFLSCIGVFLHREVYKKFFFSEDLRMIGSEDYEIWFRILAYYPVGRIEKVNCGIREHRGRSVYSSMYENLAYQQTQIKSLISSDPVMSEKYSRYVAYIDANYYYHQAMYSLHKRQKKKASLQLLRATINGKGFIFSRRFLASVKNMILNNS